MPLASTLIWGVGLLWCVYWFIHAMAYWEDDSYIHLEYARSVFQGDGFMFNGVLSNGDTSPIWVLLLAACHLLTPDWVMSGKVLTVLGVAFAAWVTYLFNKRLSLDLGLSTDTAPALMVALFVLNPYFCYWAFSGMEAVSAAGLTMLIAMLVVPRRATVGTFFGAAFAIGLAPLYRPEMVLLSAICGLFLLKQWHELTAAMPASRRLAYFGLAAVLLVLPLGIWTAYALQAFGYVLPNTNAAKRAAPDAFILMRVLQVYGLGFPAVLLGLVLVPAAWVLGRGRNKAAAEALLPMVSWPVLLWFATTIVFYVINRTHVQTRYVMVVAPAVMFVCMHLMRKLYGPRLFNAVAAGVALMAVGVSIALVHPFVRNKGIQDQKMAALADYINKSLSPSDGIAVYSIGQIGFLINNPIIDVGGITQPEAAKYLFGPQSIMVDWAKRQGAKYYIMGNEPEPGATLVIEFDVPVIGWSMNPAYYDGRAKLRLWRLPVTPS